MNAHSYEELLQSKHRLALLLFFFLNASSALFSMMNPIDPTVHVTPPLVLIVCICSSLLLVTLFTQKHDRLNLHLMAIVVGILWAAHIAYKAHYIHGSEEGTFLLFNLFSVLFISVIALSDSIKAFCLHVLPSAIMVMLLAESHEILRIIFITLLPLLGLSLHHLMLLRSDAFTKDLVIGLYQEREKFSDLSMIDPLTGLYNRRGLENKLSELLRKTPNGHYLLLLDIDHFKAYNDNYGHTMGDQALVQVAIAIRDAVRSRDIVVRYGGEEFLVLIASVDEEQASRMAERVRQQVLALEIQHMFNHDVATNVTLSAGIAALESCDLTDALKAADQALYQAKHNGRNNIQKASRANG